MNRIRPAAVLATTTLAAALALAASPAFADDGTPPTDATVTADQVTTDTATTATTDTTTTDDTATTDSTPAAPESAPTTPTTTVQTTTPTGTVGPATTIRKWILDPASSQTDPFVKDQLAYTDANVAAIPCGQTRTVQIDTYAYDTAEQVATVDALAADGVLKAGEDSSVFLSVAWDTVAGPTCAPPPPAKSNVCSSHETLTTATDQDTRGWKGYDANSGADVPLTFTSDGIVVDATAGDVAVYNDSLSFPLKDANDLGSDVTITGGTYGLILGTDANVNVHDEPQYYASGALWTTKPGVLPDNPRNGYEYTADSLDEAISNPGVVELDIYVNQGATATIHSVSFNCKVQPFAKAAVVTPPPSNNPPTDTPPASTTPTTDVKPAAQITYTPSGVLAHTGVDETKIVLFAIVALALLMSGGLLIGYPLAQRIRVRRQ